MILIQPQSTSYDEYLRFAESHGFGFEAMEYSFPAILDKPEALDRLYDRYKASPLYSFHGVFIDINYSGGDELIFEASKKRIRQCCAQAERLGVRKIVLHSCFFPILPPNDPLYDLWSEESSGLLNGITREFGVEFLIENVVDINPDVIFKMVTTAANPDINVCLDVGHANLTKTPASVWFEKLHPYIKYIHLSDNHGVYDDHTALGDGCIDWRAVFALVKKYGLKPDYTIEVKPFSNVIKSVDFCRRYGYFGI